MIQKISYMFSILSNPLKFFECFIILGVRGSDTVNFVILVADKTRKNLNLKEVISAFETGTFDKLIRDEYANPPPCLLITSDEQLTTPSFLFSNHRIPRDVFIHSND